MKCVWRIVSTAILASVLAGGGWSAGHAGELVLPSDAVHNNGIPPFSYPSDKVHRSVPFTYDMNTQTGQFELNPFDNGTTDNWFLAFAGLDDTIAACAYYKAINAVSGCGKNGELIDPITFEQWKKDVKIDRYRDPWVEEDVAHFINRVDLNLTRNHHMVSYGPNQLAGYVCNHNGPAPTADDPSGYFPTQPEIDLTLRQIRRHQNLVACVAMEFSSRGTPAGTLPFTKFWTFNPEGKLISTIDLDGRGPKGMPHVCTACHGGDFRVMSQYGDLGAHFLPFDKGNFAFSSKESEEKREEAIFRMNLNVYNTEMTRATGNPFNQPASKGSDSIVQLIKGWYKDVTKGNTSPHFDAGFVAPKWKNTAYESVYSEVVAHSCRTCHSAMDGVAFEVEDPTNWISSMQAQACGAHSMPNAKVTFDRFWLSDQPSKLQQGCTPAP